MWHEDSTFLDLRQRCREHPWDDLARLVLADYLDEQNETAWAELIRLQISLSHIHRYNSSPERIATMRAREQELLREQRLTWLGYLPLYLNLCETIEREQYWQTSTDKHKVFDELFEKKHHHYERDFDQYLSNACQFQRGLLQVRLKPDHVKYPAMIDWFAGIKAERLGAATIALGNDQPSQFITYGRLLTTSAIKRHLEIEIYLNLDHSVVAPGQHEFMLSPSEYLSLLQTNHMWTSHSEELVALRVVHHDLSEHITESLLEIPTARLRKIRLLGAGTERLRHTWLNRPFPRMHELELVGSNDQKLAELLLTASAAELWPNLSRLSIYGNQIPSQIYLNLAESKLFQQLCHVELMNTNLTNEVLRSLCLGRFLSHQSLGVLNLSMNPITARGAEYLAAWPGLQQFHELILRETKIGSAGAKALAQSPYTRQLTHLDLWMNDISESGGLALARSEYLGNLVELNLNDNPLSMKAREELTSRFGSAVRLN